MSSSTYFGLGALGLSAALILGSCKYDTRDLGPKPVASFTVAPISGQTNKYLLTSTSQNAFRYEWDKGLGLGYKAGKATDTAYFPDAGTYRVKLFVYGQSGIDSAFQTITVANDDPAALTPLKMLTGNSSRKWKMAPEAGALWVGTLDGGTTYWSSGVADVTGRSCLFNDEWTFTLAGKVMAFDSKGDMYVDEEGGSPTPAGMPPIGCYTASQIPAQYRAWVNNANFTFDVINNNKLKVMGTGAHLGAYKTGDDPLNALPAPAASVTYEIVSITPQRLVLRQAYSWGAWKYTLVSF